MNRILLLLLLFTPWLSACVKSTDVVAQVNAQSAIDGKIISTYLKDNGLPEHHVDTSGVCYVINTPGTGDNLYTNSTQVTLGYTAQQLKADETLGPIFAQTNNFHPSFVLGSVLLGWQLGIEGSKVQPGGTVTLYLPSRYAYGPYPQPDIGLAANAVLVFQITLYSVNN